MFRVIISPILRSTRLCLQLVIQRTYDAAGTRRYQPATPSVHYTTNCKHSLVLMRMGEIIARNMLSWLKSLINRFYKHMVMLPFKLLSRYTNTKTLLLLHLDGCLYYCRN